MDNEEFVEHCEGLSEMLKRHDISGFYFFCNEIPESDKVVGILGGCNVKEIPIHFLSIYGLIKTLVDLDLDRQAEKAIANSMITLIESIRKVKKMRK